MTTFRGHGDMLWGPLPIREPREAVGVGAAKQRQAEDSDPVPVERTPISGGEAIANALASSGVAVELLSVEPTLETGGAAAAIIDQAVDAQSPEGMRHAA